MFRIKTTCSQIKINSTIDPHKYTFPIIYGIVTSKNKPLYNVCISITTQSLEPITCCYTDTQGKFQINVSLPNIIYILASHKGYRIYSKKLIINNKCSPYKIKLEKEPDYKNIIIGKIVDEKNNPISYANISIKELGIQIFTNENGDFIIDNIPRGTYHFSVTSQFYKSCIRKIIVNCTQNVYNLKTIMLTGKLISGTVHGLIQCDNSNPIPNALVVLFDAAKHIPIRYTYTNQDGIYLFGNVPLGEYFIKANKTNI
ncbi:MAG: carboxypeptidase regulatory-like domain-containing protein [Clostridium sp.]